MLYWYFSYIFSYLWAQTENTSKHVMCNIRCTSREKRENASPQKPQSSAEAQGDTHTHTHETYKSQREQTLFFTCCLTLKAREILMLWQLNCCKTFRPAELHAEELLIWCRLSELLLFTDKNHNEATPANPLHSNTAVNGRSDKAE